MELFWSLSPFIVMFGIAMIAYRKYKDKVEVINKPTYLERQSFYPYLELLFFSKSRFRRSETDAFNWLFQITLLGGFVFIYLSASTTVVPLNEMQVDEGKVIATSYNKKGGVKFSVLTESGETVLHYMKTGKRTQEKLMNKNVKFWSVKRKDMYGEKFYIQQVYVDKEPFHISGDKYLVYDYYSEVRGQKMLFIIGIVLLLVGAGSLYILWILNKKEFKLHKNKLNIKED